MRQSLRCTISSECVLSAIRTAPVGVVINDPALGLKVFNPALNYGSPVDDKVETASVENIDTIFMDGGLTEVSDTLSKRTH